MPYEFGKAQGKLRCINMSIERARAYLSAWGKEDRIIEFAVSSATVELAAKALGCQPAHIAKTMSFDCNGKTILVVAAGDVKVNSGKYKQQFGVKARMLPPAEVEAKVGHGVGGVCPFGVNEGVAVYLDESLKRFETVYPAAGNAASAVRLTPQELAALLPDAAWVNVCKGPEDE